MKVKLEDSFWSTEEGIKLISFCHQQLEEHGLEKCLLTCTETNNKDLIPIFQTAYENITTPKE